MGSAAVEVTRGDPVVVCCEAEGACVMVSYHTTKAAGFVFCCLVILPNEQ